MEVIDVTKEMYLQTWMRWIKVSTTGFEFETYIFVVWFQMKFEIYIR